MDPFMCVSPFLLILRIFTVAGRSRIVVTFYSPLEDTISKENLKPRSSENTALLAQQSKNLGVFFLS